jgi:hypothetical protein
VRPAWYPPSNGGLLTSIKARIVSLMRKHGALPQPLSKSKCGIAEDDSDDSNHRPARYAMIPPAAIMASMVSAILTQL